MQTPAVESILSDLNTNLVMSKRSLMDMRDSGDRTFRTRTGSVMEIPEEQIERLWEVCDDSERLRLKLPIYVSTDVSGDVGAWKVEGKVEAAVVAKLIGRKMYRDDVVRLHYPDLKDLKKEISDAIMIIFTP